VALADVTLTVGPGEFMAVMGATGSAKSTMLTKLDLPPAAGDHRRVLAVLRFIRAAGS
jgi:ABC-type lipoprotein export system ATPase subunit